VRRSHSARKLTPMTRPRIALTLAALALAVPLAACGTETIDTGKVEDEVVKGIENQTDAENVKVDCPDDVEAKKGDTFECEVSAAKSRGATVSVEQTSDDGHIRWELK
jgi:uncharacterized protein DUF4333